jgi:hypothetical protein
MVAPPDPAIGPVTLTISGTSATLLGRLTEALGSNDPGATFMRALGLLDLALKAKREGKRLTFVDPRTGESSEVAW